MNRYNVELVFRGLDPRIQEKIKKLYEDSELGEYIESIVISHEVEILENNIKQENDRDIKTLYRRIERLEDRIVELEKRKFIVNEKVQDGTEEDLTEDGEVQDFDTDALDFVNNLLSI